jgi:MinD-like ATPase involved in chromosome partitioning or flagellar assembly
VDLFKKRVTVFVGHFGSGKTEIALNGALQLAAAGDRVTLADLDVVKPYFRSRSAREILEAAGIQLLAPTGEAVHADLPIIVPQIRSALRDPSCRLVMDVGGDDTGAKVLGSLSDVVQVSESELLVVLNFRRPSTPTVATAVAMVQQIERAARVKVTGLVSNTHLMAETTPGIVLEGHRLAVKAGKELDVPVVAVVASRDVAADLRGDELGCPVFVLDRVVLPPFEQPLRVRASGPLFVVN